MTLARRLATPRAGLLGLAALATVAFLALLATADRACARCGVDSAVQAPESPAFDGIPTPAPDDPAPAPVPDRPAPATHDAAPASDDPVPATHDAAPAPDDPVPATHDAAPAPDDSVPATHDAAPAPASDDPAPATHDAAPAPASAASADLTAAARYVRAFYADLVARRFAAAWPRLAADVRARHGSLDAWRHGFATTVRQSTSPLTARPAGSGAAVVTLTLTAVDRDRCGQQVTRRFAVEWRLRRSATGWSAFHAAARPLGAAPVRC